MRVSQHDDVIVYKVDFDHDEATRFLKSFHSRLVPPSCTIIISHGSPTSFVILLRSLFLGGTSSRTASTSIGAVELSLRGDADGKISLLEIIQAFMFSIQSAPPAGVGAAAGVPEVAHHWFYRVRTSGKSQWKPFSMIDSVAIEEIFVMNPKGGAFLSGHEK